MKSKVNVLLSTYNGHIYLETQLESILQQENVQVELYIRDDGSSDSTRKILRKFESQRNIHIIYGENIGWKKSYFRLLESINPSLDEYVAFADQDDYWCSQKLIKAVEKINETNLPAVYHSNVAIVNEKLDFLSYRFPADFIPDLKLPRAFFDSIALGCTMVFNAALFQLVKRHVPDQETQHDAYVYALGYLFGKVYYDPTPYIQYRRYTGATTSFGSLPNSGKPTLLMRYRRYRKGPKNNFSIRAQELIKGYSKMMDENQRSFLNTVAFYQDSPFKKLKLLCRPTTATGFRRTFQIKFRILLNTL